MKHIKIIAIISKMPIKDKTKYPANWKQISEYIRFTRAQNKCEFCGVQNYTIGWRSADGTLSAADSPTRNGEKLIKVILTTAHLDHDTTNNDHNNLRALCQRCHLRHDLELHKANAARTRAGNNSSQQQLF
jgi:hypothetical protein